MSQFNDDLSRLFKVKYLSVAKTDDPFLPGRYDYYLKDVNSNLNEIIDFDNEHYHEIVSGDGGELEPYIRNNVQLPPKMSCTYSSSALAYNCFSFIRCDKSFRFSGDLLNSLPDDTYNRAEFEFQIRPLKGTNPANLDVALIGSKSIIFIESKCLETFARANFEFGESYTKTHRYGNDAFAEKWKNLIFCTAYQAPDIHTYDIAQMLKHLLAISRNRDETNFFGHTNSKYKFKPVDLKGKQLILLNLVWDFVPESNIDMHGNSIIDNVTTLDRIQSIQSESSNVAKKWVETLNRFLVDDLGILQTEIKVVYEKYSNFIKNSNMREISNKDYEYFMNRYYTPPHKKE